MLRNVKSIEFLGFIMSLNFNYCFYFKPKAYLLLLAASKLGITSKVRGTFSSFIHIIILFKKANIFL